MYSAIYTIFADNKEPACMEIDGYGSVEDLKSQTSAVLNKLVEANDIPDGIINVEMSIEKNEEFFDCDSADFAIEGGKIKMI